MVRRGATRAGLGEWILLGCVVAVSLGMLFSSVAARSTTARLLRNTVFFPFKLVLGYAPHPPDVHAELLDLRREVAARAYDASRCAEVESENRRLREMLDFTTFSPRSVIPAEVIGRPADRFGETLVLAPPAGARVYAGQPVLGAAGLVGCVSDADRGECRVHTLRNAALHVSGLLLKTRRVGLLRWRTRDDLLALEGIPLQDTTQVGDSVITSGFGRIFPKGILIGTVTAVRNDSTAVAKEILIRPAVDSERAEELFLLGE